MIASGWFCERWAFFPGKIISFNLLRYASTNNAGWQVATLKYDMMKDYRETVPVEEQDSIWEEVSSIPQ